MTRVDDQSLLVGLLALQNRLIDPVSLIDAHRAWHDDPDGGRGLDRVLVDVGFLDEVTHAALSSKARAMLEGTVEEPGGDGSDGDEPDLDGGEDEAEYGPEGRYRNAQLHARGGLGEVHRAYDERLNREVALKQIRRDRADDPVSRSRFLFEAEITSQLEHPGVVPVYDLGCRDDGRPFYVMRFVQGVSLAEAIAEFHAEAARLDPGERALSLRKLLRRFLDACNAVDYAHSQDVIHRDLKPANVMLGDYGETLVIDWGLAKALGQGVDEPTEALPPDPGDNPSQTAVGSAVGTRGYMSPEQAAGETGRIGPASDIYSLGATLYHLLVGRPAFTEEDRAIIHMQTCAGVFPRPREVNPDVPRPLESVCLKAMELQPEDRYGSVRELVDDVEHWLADEPVSAHRENVAERLARWSRRHQALVRAAALTTVIVALVSSAAAAIVQKARRNEQTALALAETNLDDARLNLGIARQAVDDTVTALAGDVLNGIPQMGGIRKNLADKARMFHRHFLKVSPYDPTVREAAIPVFRFAGRTESLVGDIEGAKKDYGEALALARGLVKEFPSEPRYAHKFAEVCNNLGALLAGQGRLGEAVPVLREGLDAMIRVRAAGGIRGESSQRTEAYLCSELAQCALDSGRAAEALDEYRRLATVFRLLADRNQSTGKDVWYLALTLRGQAEALRELGQPVEAEAPLSEAIRRLEKISDNDSNARYLLASALVDLGLTRSNDLGRRVDAEAHFTQALDLLDRLRQEQPAFAPYRREWASAYNGRGAARAAIGKGRWDEAEADFRAAHVALQPLVAPAWGEPATADLLQSARSLTGLGRLARDRGAFDDAQVMLQKATDPLERALRINPVDPALHRELEQVRADIKSLGP